MGHVHGLGALNDLEETLRRADPHLNGNWSKPAFLLLMTGAEPEAEIYWLWFTFFPLRCDAQIKCALDCVRLSAGLRVVVLLLYGHSRI